MLNIPQDIKDLLHQDTCKKNIRIVFPNGERTDICNDLIVKDSVSFKESLCSQNSFKFGLAEASIFECETVGVGNIKGATIEVFCEVYCPQSVSGAVWQTDLQAWVYQIEYGTFKVQSCDRQADLIHRKILCYSLLNGNEGIINPVTLNIITEGTSANNAYTPDLMKMAFANVPRNIDLGFTTETLTVSETAESIITFGSAMKADSEYSGLYSIFRIMLYVNVHEYTIGSNGISEDDLVKISQSIKLTKAFANALYEAIDAVVDSSLWHDQITRNSLMQWEYEEVQSPLMNLSHSTLMTLDNIISVMKYGCVRSSKVAKEESYGTYINVARPTLLSLIDVDSFYAKGIEPGAKLLLFSGTSARVRLVQPPAPEVIGPDPIVYYDKTVTFKETDQAISLSRIIPPFAMAASFDREVRTIPWYGGTTFTSRYVPKLDNFSVYKALDAALELIGCFMNNPRNGQAAIINIKDKFGLTPSNTLYPNESLKPLGVTGGSILPEDYQTCWYDEHYTLPFGAIVISYKLSGTDAQQKIYITGYNDTSDETTYQNYYLTDNIILQNRDSTDEELNAIATIIGNNINGVTYMPVKLVGRGLPYVASGDTFEIFTKAGDSITTIVLSRTIKGEMHLVDEYVSVL